MGIFTKIWFSPRIVFRHVNDYCQDEFVKPLLFLAGISRAFDRASIKDLGDTMSLFGICAMCILVGGFLGWIAYYIYALAINWTGKWLKGAGNTASILRVMAYAMITSVAALVLLIPQIIICGNGLFQSDWDILEEGLLANLVFWPFWFLEVVLGIWTIVLLIIGVSEVQKFSIWKSILNILMPGLLFFIFIFLFVFVKKII